jgi:thymidylate kinase
MLILEGSDTVGKSTLAKRCVELLNARGYPHVPRHLSRLPASWAAQPHHNYVRLCSPYLVQDRFHVSEPIYARARGEKPMITREQYAVVESYLKLVGGFTVVIAAEPELIERRYDAGREMYKLAQVQQVNTYYLDIIQTGEFDGFETHAAKTLYCTADYEWPSAAAEEICDAYVDSLSRVVSYPGANLVCVP